MRIVAGSARGRPLAGPKHEGLRPTSDRTRQVLFDLLGQTFAGGAVLDLYCGTGALALEALSRGCESALCVDVDPRALKLVLQNSTALGFAGRVTTERRDLPSGLATLPRTPRQLVFADPPYANAGQVGSGDSASLRSLLHWVSASGILAPGDATGGPTGGVLVIETSKHSDFDVPTAEGLIRSERRTLGDTVLHLYQRGS